MKVEFNKKGMKKERNEPPTWGRKITYFEPKLSTWLVTIEWRKGKENRVEDCGGGSTVKYYSRHPCWDYKYNDAESKKYLVFHKPRGWRARGRSLYFSSSRRCTPPYFQPHSQSLEGIHSRKILKKEDYQIFFFFPFIKFLVNNLQ